MIDSIFEIKSEGDFLAEAERVFKFQYENVKLYRQYCDLMDINSYPYLPISFFKSHDLIKENTNPEIIFSSSRTTGLVASRHLVANKKIYEDSFLKAFGEYYGNPKEYCFLALLPSYLEREGSSLIYMVDELIKRSSFQQSGFYLNELKDLSEILRKNQHSSVPTILLGVSYALLDLAEQFPQDLSSINIMETGGMKGNRPEMLKTQLHKNLCKAFNVNNIHSEYGMTELLSQAYSKGKGRFFTPPWMKIEIRDIYDPLAIAPLGKTGGINIIDLANINSCSFIQTDDLGRKNADGSFEILGRMNASDIRGCNLLVQD